MLLTKFLRDMLLEQLKNKIDIITPIEEDAHGSQLSFKVKSSAENIVKALNEKHIIVDFRAPDIIRVAPVALYNSFNDIYQFVSKLQELV